MEKKQQNFLLPVEIIEKIDALAERMNLSKTAIIIVAINQLHAKGLNLNNITWSEAAQPGGRETQ